jgi:Flp pilus assembly protein TadG
MTRRLASDDGQVTAMWVVLALALLILGTVIYGGSEILGARRDMSNLALQAARAGAQELDEYTTATTNVAVLDERRAEQSARDYLTATAPSGATWTANAQGSRVTVVVRWDKPVAVLGLVGIDTTHVEATESALAVRG